MGGTQRTASGAFWRMLSKGKVRTTSKRDSGSLLRLDFNANVGEWSLEDLTE
jgi:hypothetical protein